MPGLDAQSRSQKLVARANMLLPGLYAWVVTVAFPAATHDAPAAARVALSPTTRFKNAWQFRLQANSRSPKARPARPEPLPMILSMV